MVKDEVDDDTTKAWLEEQAVVASKVVVLPDRIPAETVLFENDGFCLVRGAMRSAYYGGVDVSFPKDDEMTRPAVAVYVVVDSTGRNIVYQDYEYFHLSVPYIPSFLAFREIAPLQRLVERQQTLRPDVTPAAVLVDGNGILHPRGAGIASFLGVRVGIPTIGVAKTLFCEGGLTKERVLQGLDESVRHACAFAGSVPQCHTELAVLFDNSFICPRATPAILPADDSDAPSLDRQELLHTLAPICLGLAVPLASLQDANDHKAHISGERNYRILVSAVIGHGGGLRRDKPRRVGSKNPIYVSVGHQISLYEAVKICVQLSLTRIPEPVRQADLIGRELLRNGEVNNEQQANGRVE